ncbi:MAG TPA: DnaJ C-terminal domain-containing protein, partial [Burkholderiaceae bacterium]|nr:DnaJ C-terminal domain-containing protein [Burkholderiaceae bacterium]
SKKPRSDARRRCGRLARACAACGGHGRDRIDPRCADCNGAGVVTGTAWFGWLSTQWSCPACKGRGSVSRPCAVYAGRGETTSAWRRTLRIPVGVRQADVLVADGPPDADGQGEIRLEVEIEIAPHRLFEADDNGSLRCEMPVDGFAWIANAWIEVPTLAGLQQMRLQRGRRVYRLRGQGLPLQRGASARGDYLVTVIPTFPDTLSKRQQSLLEQLAKTTNGADPDVVAAPLRAWRSEIENWNRNRGTRAPDA